MKGENSIFRFSAFLAIALFCFNSANVFATTNTISIGVLAYNGKVQALQRWQATADYLSHKIPAYDFQIKPLTHEEFQHAINKGELDFFLTNPGHYIRLEVKEGATRLATFQTHYNNQVLTQISSVIFTRKSSNIEQLNDLKGKRFAAVNQAAFGGFQVAQFVFKTKNIDALSDMQIKWLGFPHADIVSAVLSGKADAGVVRAGVLEELVKTKKINLDDFQILNPQEDHNFPFLHSTPLYPEWPFASLPSTDSNLSKQVGLALLQMPLNDEAAVTSGGAGWTIPLDYSRVHELFKILKIEPYPPAPLKLTDFWKAYQVWIIIIFSLLLLSLLSLLKVLKVNHHLNVAKQVLRRHRNTLEETVKQRTNELSVLNKSLQEDIQCRISIEKNMHNACDALEGLYQLASRYELSRQQRLQSILDMSRQYLGDDQVLLSRWDIKQQQFSFCAASPESPSQASPIIESSALKAVLNNEIIMDKSNKSFHSYLAFPVKIAEGHQCLFEFTSSQSGDDNDNETIHEYSEIHRRILQMISLWLGNEMALLDQEQATHDQKEKMQQCFATISPREFEVLKHLVKGETNKVMARYLNISPKTIELHRANLLKKTGAKSSIELVKLAVESEIIKQKI